MSDSSDEHSHDEEEQLCDDPPHRRRGRGVTNLNDIVLRHETNAGPLQIDFDRRMRPIGPNRRRFSSYIGYVARTKISILDHKWKLVNPDTKNRAWTDIVVSSNIFC